jgi:hypothetical protein
MPNRTVCETDRLALRPAGGDAGLFYNLWTDPRVMTNVGFPRGIPITIDEIRTRIRNQGESEFDQLIVVILRTADAANEPYGPNTNCCCWSPKPFKCTTTSPGRP